MQDLSATQLGNARLVFDAAAPWGSEVQVAALMCALDESSLLRYANDGSTTRSDVPQHWRDVAATSLGFPHDAVAGSAFTSADSVGLFQQRPMFDYGSMAELMDPAESTRIFIRGSHGGAGTTRFFLQAPAGLTLAQRIQWTQGSEFPTGDNYRPFEPVARQLVALFTQDKDWVSMATQAEVKQAFADALTEWKTTSRVDGKPYPVDKFLAGLDEKVYHQFDTPCVKSQVDGNLYTRDQFLISIDRKLTEVLNALAAKK